MSRTGLLIAVLVFTVACTPLPRRPADVAPYYSSTENQVLVMLRQSPPHFRPDENYGYGYDARFGHQARQRTAARIATEHHLQLVADWPMAALGVDCFLMQASAPVVDLARSLAKDPRVESVQAMQLFHTLGHNDPFFSLQPSAKPWHLDELHRFTTGKNVAIAIIDTGVDTSHPDLREQIAAHFNFVDGTPYAAEYHGTAVAGIIAASADNGLGIAGIAPQSRLLALRACWQERGGNAAALCNSFTLAKALQFALDHDVQIINLSLGGPRDRLLERLLDVARARGITVVSAVDAQQSSGGFPASHPGVLAVAGDEASNRGRPVIIAPVRDVPTTLPGDRWGFVSGTSFAAAEVSGVVALLCQLSPRIAPAQVRRVLLSASTTQLTADRPTVLDVCTAVTRIMGTCACNCTVTRETRPLSLL